MDDYPSSMTALEKRFALREECLSYLASLRWPSGYVCPRCGSDKSWTMENGLILCSGCRRQQSVTAGTVFQDSHMPLPTWFRAMWHVCTNKNGM
jgi:transposase-like protein